MKTSQTNALRHSETEVEEHAQLNYVAKGLEFDRVVVPEASAANYHTAMERNLLYVACTCAMHHLTITHTGDPCSFLPDPGKINFVD